VAWLPGASLMDVTVKPLVALDEVIVIAPPDESE
jgi:hypothetical protein